MPLPSKSALYLRYFIENFLLPHFEIQPYRVLSVVYRYGILEERVFICLLITHWPQTGILTHSVSSDDDTCFMPDRDRVLLGRLLFSGGSSSYAKLNLSMISVYIALAVA